MLFHPVAAGLMIVTSLVCANVARAELTIVLPINLTGLDPGARFVQPYCAGFGADAQGRTLRFARGALRFQEVTGGQFVRTVRIPMRRFEAAGGPVTEYACGVSVWGQRRDGVAYMFNTPAVAAFARPSETYLLSRQAWGMSGDSWSWPGDGPYAYHGVVAPILKGSSPQYFSGGVFLPAQVRALAEVEASPVAEECPCGCGAGGADGAACSSAKAKEFWDNFWNRLPHLPDGARHASPPPAPAPTAERSPTAIATESRRLGLDGAATRPPIAPGRGPVERSAAGGTPITVEAPAIVFRGTGVFERYVP